MARFYYNGILLPEIPQDTLQEYPYCWIRKNNPAGTYDAIFGTQPWYNVYNSDLHCLDSNNIIWYTININEAETSDIWYFNKNTTGSFGVDTNRPIIWSNKDIYISAANPPMMFFAASEPVPEVPYELYEIRNTTLTDIADSLRRKTGKTDPIQVSQFAQEIKNISVGGDSEELLGLFDGTATEFNNDSITKLRDFCFYSHPTLKSVNLYDCKSIGNQAFYSCSQLTNISFPNCTNIGNSAFMYCSSLTSANFPKCQTIPSAAFYNCGKMQSASFPVCTTIGSSAFMYCSSLNNISFPVCSTIGSSAFYQCSSLAAANFPSCKTIGTSAFTNCGRLTTLSFPVCTAIQPYAFSGCGSLTEANFPNCTTIYNGAFYSCSKLSSVSFPNCTSIQDAAFMYCYSLSMIDLPQCTSVSGFSYCSNLTSINLPKGSIIGNYAFCGCINLPSIDLPMVTSVYNYAFQSCNKLSTINLPICKSIGTYAFMSCYSLASINLPAATTISSHAFRLCSSLSRVDLSVCSIIGSSAFMSCSKLDTLILHNSAIVSLPNVTAFYSTPMSLSSYIGGFGSIYVPASLIANYKAATNWSVYSNRFATIEDWPDIVFGKEVVREYLLDSSRAEEYTFDNEYIDTNSGYGLNFEYIYESEREQIDEGNMCSVIIPTDDKQEIGEVTFINDEEIL